MSIRLRLTYLFLLAVLSAAGCGQNDELAELIEESPFRNRSPQRGPELAIVAFQYYPLELPAEVDITEWDFWKKYSGGSEAAGAGGIGRMGFEDRQTRLWRENGLHVITAPGGSWPELQGKIVEAGGRALRQTSTFLRRAAEFAEFQTVWVSQSTYLFVSDESGALSGSTLPAGNCVLGVNCWQDQTDPVEKRLNVKLTPLFYHAQAEERFGRDEFGTLRMIVDRPKVVWESLALNGGVETGQFICIAARPGKDGAGKLGQFLLTPGGGGNNTQLVVVLAPILQTATMMKQQGSGW